MDAVDPVASKIGAVNTIKIANGKLTGYNTDVYGFRQLIFPLLKDHHKRALVLGTGGSAKAVVYVLKELGVGYQFVSRSPGTDILEYNQVGAEQLNEHKIVINTTPVGMYPDIENAPSLPYHFLDQTHLLIDLVYNPTLTKFLMQGIQQGCLVKNGLEMLFAQAEKSWKIWTN